MYFIFKKEMSAMPAHEGQAGKGFTIIEIIIAIFILSIAVVGIFSAFSVVTILTSDSADRLTATYLAQEGMEIVRNIRDTNWLYMDAGIPANTTWVDGLGVNGQTIDCASGCQADYAATTMSPYAAGSYLYLDSNDFYNYNSGGTKTKFERKIIITPETDVDNDSSNPHIIMVNVQVSWDEKATVLSGFIPAGSPDPSDPFNLSKCNPSNCIETEGTLYDWYNKTIPVTGVTLNENSATINVGSTDQLTATIAPNDATNHGVTWSSDNEAVATVDGGGLVTANSAGSANITVTTTDGSHTDVDALTVVNP